ncbi:hypothetical protein EJ08DRAFT_684379 [Tothia fuscella]|uniref:Ipa protein n=1 Tax=Tothia fuscella TaxID=1048955 RepID=A0A9P4TS69_9PEZI|nr:hypothetical protein EJ08DRAFT_684379 [Tothia fuscella]
MDQPELGKEDGVRILHEDLARKYQLHRPKIEQLWRSFNAKQRARVFKAGIYKGIVLKHSRDWALGDVYKVIPELNLKDIAESGPDHILDMLEHRATKPLVQQYCEGVNGGPGDCEFILNSMRDNNLRYVEEFKYAFTIFEEDGYGESYCSPNASKFQIALTILARSFENGIEIETLQTLNILVEDILDASSTRSTQTRTKKSTEVIATALSKLAILPQPEKLSLQDLIAIVLDQKSSLYECLNLCHTEPVFFAHAVNAWFFSRPELLQDQKGRSLPLHTDRYISISLFEVMHNAVAGAVNWDYLHRLVELLDDSGCDGHSRRSTILQELSNVCHLEYRRAQALFKRHVQTSSGVKFFRRISGVVDDGSPRVSMKVKPEALTRSPQLHFMLRLCLAETDVFKAFDWIKKLDELHRHHPSEREEMRERDFVQSLSTVLTLPPNQVKKNQVFESKSKELAQELNSLESEVELLSFAIPIDNLLEPGMTEGALSVLDQFVVEKMGANMGSLYQDLIESCMLEVNSRFEQKKAKGEENASEEPLPTPIRAASLEVQLQHQKQKEKSRPVHSLVEKPDEAPAVTESDIAEPTQVFKVKQSTFNVFSTLFSRTQSRSSISWTEFGAAMADLKFALLPKTGSIFTFSPPEDARVKRALTLHRPHGSRIEGYRLLFYSARMQRTYGWSEQSFEVT